MNSFRVIKPSLSMSLFQKAIVAEASSSAVDLCALNSSTVSLSSPSTSRNTNAISFGLLQNSSRLNSPSPSRSIKLKTGRKSLVPHEAPLCRSVLFDRDAVVAVGVGADEQGFLWPVPEFGETQSAVVVPVGELKAALHLPHGGRPHVASVELFEVQDSVAVEVDLPEFHLRGSGLELLQGECAVVVAIQDREDVGSSLHALPATPIGKILRQRQMAVAVGVELLEDRFQRRRLRPAGRRCLRGFRRVAVVVLGRGSSGFRHPPATRHVMAASNRRDRILAIFKLLPNTAASCWSTAPGCPSHILPTRFVAQ